MSLSCDPRAIRDLALPFIREAEGLRLKAYADPATGGEPWTIGYGATGPDIHRDSVWTKDKAESDLARRIDGLLVELGACITAPLWNEGYAALLSLAYNVGMGNMRKSLRDGLLSLVNAERYEEASNRFLVYDKANGRVFEPLHKRRQRERMLFLSGLPQPFVA